MTESLVVYTDRKSGEAGADLAAQIRAGLGDRIPDAIILFASPVNDFPSLLSALASGRTRHEFTGRRAPHERERFPTRRERTQQRRKIMNGRCEQYDRVRDSIAESGSNLRGQIGPRVSALSVRVDNE